jgi:hypothetical protein
MPRAARQSRIDRLALAVLSRALLRCARVLDSAVVFVTELQSRVLDVAEDARDRVDGRR